MDGPVAGREFWHWYGWKGSGPFWANAVLLALLPLLRIPLVAQIAVVTTLAALGGLLRQVVVGDYGHLLVHAGATALGAAGVVLGLTVFMH
ncbi:hypothetical protein [Streptomyces sp. NPDC097619]|uniref:hypothetical protein n=1 Tax=Streptomyces sp. NPDC097619 TaxID=3157228 RepID=UPI0033277B13